MPKKSDTAPKIPASLDFKFVGGPRDGDTIRLANPPWGWIRLGMPEWSTYQFDGAVFRYRGVEPPPEGSTHRW